MPGPSILRLATEVAAVGELGAFTMSTPLVKRWLPRGDRPVFVMPGFLAGDGSTLLLRRTLDRLGQPLNRWRPFEVHRSLRGLFPAAPTFRVTAEHANG